MLLTGEVKAVVAAHSFDTVFLFWALMILGKE